MKYLTIIISVIALGLMIFNFTKVDFSAPFEGDSIIALITIAASLCVILMMLILRTSKRIEQKVKKRN
ncbi:hypothetical protein [Flavivirga eckloniae]|uniref:Uncharacterized protein n=1 Tax=Flavivirga eckloniae TaxID=1803846 RepID=A0A2K9PR26_9FLAO|nr:hypothetical protein [Flavivirga eckloniae]AUP79037.1 hypothetical protein C1H87_10140 [Flavivirga eckloniae]